MATVIKKISELEQLGELTSSSNVIIEENGEAKRFSAANIGKVKTVNGVEPDENGNIEVEVGGEQVQPDLAQNDSTQPDYVKNRTHWEEVSATDIIPEVTATISSNGGRYKLSDDVAAKKLTAGRTYLVLFDGVAYECVSREYTTSYGYRVLILGNGTLNSYDGDNNTGNGEQFLLCQYPDNSTYLFADKAGEYTIAIPSEIVIRKLSPRFLPDGGFGYEAELNNVEILPETTVNIEENNGLFYREIAPTQKLAQGKAYFVVFDGEVYECTSRAYDGMGAIIGNGTIDSYGDGDAGNDEPFYICQFSNGWASLNVVEAGEYTISITGYGLVPHQIDSKYIPPKDAFTVNVILEDEDDYYAEYTENVTIVQSFDEILSAIKSGRHIYVHILTESGRGGLFDSPNISLANSNADAYSEVADMYDGCTVLFKLQNDKDDDWGRRFIEILKDGTAIYSNYTDPNIPDPHNNEGAFLRVVDGAWTAVNAPIPAIPDVTSAPTMEEFNALLAALRNAGLMATE